jgi:hypothetical protein
VSPRCEKQGEPRDSSLRCGGCEGQRPGTGLGRAGCHRSDCWLPALAARRNHAAVAEDEKAVGARQIDEPAAEVDRADARLASGLFPATARQAAVVGRIAAVAPGAPPKARRAAVPTISVTVRPRVSARVRSISEPVAGAARSTVPAGPASVGNLNDRGRCIQRSRDRHGLRRPSGRGESHGGQRKRKFLHHLSSYSDRQIGN